MCSGLDIWQLCLVESTCLFPLRVMESSWPPDWMQNPVQKSQDYQRLSSAFSCRNLWLLLVQLQQPSLNPMTAGNLKMDELLAFPPWFLDSLVNVWKALWSSRVLSAIIIRDLSYECWLKKIIVAFLPFTPFFNSFFFFNILFKENSNWLPREEVERKSWMCYWHRRCWCSPNGEHLRMEKSGKTGLGLPSANVPRMNKIYGTGLLLFAHSRSFQFLFHEREGMIWSCFGNWFSCPLAGIVSLGCPVWQPAGNGCVGCLVPCQPALHGWFQTPAPQNKISLSNQVRNGWCCTCFKDKVSIKVFVCSFVPQASK